MKDLKKEVNQEEKGCIKEKGVDEGAPISIIHWQLACST